MNLSVRSDKTLWNITALRLTLHAEQHSAFETTLSHALRNHGFHLITGNQASNYAAVHDLRYTLERVDDTERLAVHLTMTRKATANRGVAPVDVWEESVPAPDLKQAASELAIALKRACTAGLNSGR